MLKWLIWSIRPAAVLFVAAWVQPLLTPAALGAEEAIKGLRFATPPATARSSAPAAAANHPHRRRTALPLRTLDRAPSPSAAGTEAELWHFMRVRKKWWLAPILVTMVLLSALIVLTQGSAVAPFIYALF